MSYLLFAVSTVKKVICTLVNVSAVVSAATQRLTQVRFGGPAIEECFVSDDASVMSCAMMQVAHTTDIIGSERTYTIVPWYSLFLGIL
jgi:hypothetical protein